ncbi:RNA-splicing ligase RtcB [Candidatus Woesearchaeota archaeon CG10_big_fil_rev_8_21_14_0_10_44_13]|nr:MAG: RNA-splicing ligase RtcB [Candidatus Woesearchaeota archaeon CG10_big_fil_rev_8_21_14_0_10_44_13]
MVEFNKISGNVWNIPKSGKMLVPATIYASERLMDTIKQDKTLEQARNVACLKGIQKSAYVMPDAHQGYGFPIGGVAAFDPDEGIISPGGVGYDINCSVRLLKTNLSVEEFMKKRHDLIEALFVNVPSGVGRGGKTRVDRNVIMEVLSKGAQWAVEEGFGRKDDYLRTEENGKMSADPHAVSDRAISRGLPQLGSLGAGNHFLEIQKIDQIYDEKIAKAFGLQDKDNVTVMIHCGSRGLGHQVASDYIKEMEDKYGFKDLPDRELINAPINSDLGQRYYRAMGAGANFAFANKQMITHWVREVFEKIYGSVEIDVVYDVCHNIAKMEKHKIDGKLKQVCVHRKGATRSFGPGREEIPDVYRSVGQPVIIPGSMGTASFVLVGTKTAEEITFGSTAHGAGRVSSRSAALQNISGEHVKNELAKKGIEIKATSWKSIAEEAPEVYKDIDEVVRVSHEVGIGNLVVRVVPLSVMKG